ncbi:hypothetical protein [Streptomyces longisporus]|uniref:Transposase n=1 Tax=Streptomyces longisporus TaxID=1948 RepID=A0ABN3LZ31_STRLO
MRDGSVVWLPVPYVGAEQVRSVEEQVVQLHALRRRYSREVTPHSQ